MNPAATYGDVTGEYLALRRNAAIVPGTHDLVWVRGPDTIGFLDGLVSQDVGALEPGDVARSLLLAPQGKLRATLRLLAAGDGVGLVADRGVGQTVVDDLSRFKIRVDATIELEPVPMASLIGPEVGGSLTAAGLRAPGPKAWTGEGGSLVAAAPFQAATLPRFLVDAEAAARLAGTGTPRAGEIAATAVRIESGEPVMGRDIADTTIPQEAGVVDGAVSFTKGCYLGQELVARIDSRGRVNRHLRGVVITTNVLPPPGAEVSSGSHGVGTVTSVGESLDLRAPVALALIRREVDPGDEVTITWPGGRAGAVVRRLPLIG
jgi:folate-binding protein YgfZ